MAMKDKTMKKIILELLPYFFGIASYIIILRMMIISIQYNGKYCCDFNAIGEFWIEFVVISLILIFLIIMTIRKVIYDS